MLADTNSHYPGTPQHQAILRAIVDHYENDQRILAVAVFGSLGRGNWDEYSDIDLDVVIADQVSLDAVEELTQLCLTFEPLGERIAVIIADDTDAGDVVFESLLQMSVRYHPLAATHPNIVESLQVLTGRIDHSVIAAAGAANRQPSESLEQVLSAVCAICGRRRHRLAAAPAVGRRGGAASPAHPADGVVHDDARRSAAMAVLPDQSRSGTAGATGSHVAAV